jgi:hypothetical protein
MKAKTNTLLIVVALLAYWLGLCNASAFYDPGTQRWLNRDPIGEGAGINVYEFVEDAPVGRFDKFGLQSVLAYLACFDKRIHPTTEGKCQCLCVVDGSVNQDCQKTCISCSSINNPKKACECYMRSRKDTVDPDLPEYQINKTCDKFPDVDLPCPKPKPTPEKPLPPISIPNPPPKNPWPKPNV